MQTAADILKHNQKIRLIGADPFTAGGYTQIPNAILCSKFLSDAAKVAYRLILSHARQKNFCFPGQETMGEGWGKSSRSVRTDLKELEKAGLLKIKQQGFGRANIYELHVRVADGKVKSLK